MRRGRDRDLDGNGRRPIETVGIAGRWITILIDTEDELQMDHAEILGFTRVLQANQQ